MSKTSICNFSISEIEKHIQAGPLYTIFFNLVVLSLFFIQALRAYIPSVYVAMFHVVFGSNVIENFLIIITLIIFLFPFLTNTLCKSFGTKKVLLLSIYITAITRLLLAFHFPNIMQAIFCGIIVASYSIFISTFLTLWNIQEKDKLKSENKLKFVILAILFAFLLDYSIRTVGFSQDISLLPPALIAEFWYVTQYFWLLIQVPLTFLSVYFTNKYLSSFNFNITVKEKGKYKRRSTIYSLIYAGMGMFWFLLFNIFLYSNIIGHYTRTDYYISNIMSIISIMGALCIIICLKKRLLSKIEVSLILNLFMLTSLFFFLFLGEVLSYISLVLVHFSLIVFYIDFYVLFSHMMIISFKWENPKTISNLFTIGILFYILFSVLHIFTTDWAYVIPTFKGYGSFFVFIAGIILMVSVFLSLKISLNKEVIKEDE